MEERYRALKIQYDSLGRKQSAISIDNREQVWKLFLNYERIRKTNHLYDSNDLVANLFRRLEDHGLSGVWVHRLYVDEVQDFTMAEIYLLMRLTDPNFSFLAGDTAQTIARGVGFRFSELKTLFNEMNQEYQEEDAKAQRVIRTQAHILFQRAIGATLASFGSLPLWLRSFIGTGVPNTCVLVQSVW
jgi:superfamily I DNA/RNA helicase